MSVHVDAYQGLGYPRIWESKDLTNPGSFLEGEVGVQIGTGARRRLSCRFIDSKGGLTPSVASDIFTPYGHELRPYRGIVLPNGTVENIPLGVFGITDVEITDSGAGVQIQVECYDRAKKVSDSKLIQDYSINAGLKFTTEIQNFLVNHVPQLTFNFADLSYLTPQISLKAGDDPWQASQDMAASIGCELFFDVLGICTLQVIPNYDAVDPVWTYAEGKDATILSVNKRLTNQGAYNYYIFTGENSGNTTPVRGDAYDDNPNSATYYKGPYGTVPAPIESSKLITSTTQATAAAVGALQSTVGFSERVHFNAIVNPAHDVGDVIHITREASKVDAKYIMDQLSIPLTHNRAMDSVTRFRQPITSAIV